MQHQLIVTEMLLEFDEILDIIQLPDLIKLGYASPVLSSSSVDTSTLKKCWWRF